MNDISAPAAISFDSLIALKKILSYQPSRPIFLATDSEFARMAKAMGSLLSKIDSNDGVTSFTVNHINFGGLAT